MCRTVIKLNKNWDYFEWIDITFNYFMRPKSFKKEGKKSGDRATQRWQDSL